MKAFFLSVFYTLITLCAGAVPQQVRLSEKQNRLAVIEKAKDHLALSHTLGVFSINKQLKNTGFFEIQLQGYSRSFEVGCPQLPVKTQLIEIPLGAEVKISIKDSQHTRHKLDEWNINDQLKPVQAPVAKNGKHIDEFQLKNEIYKRNAFYKQPLVKLEVLGIMRDKRVARISISPFQYNPMQNSLKVYEQIDFQVNFIHPDRNGTMKLKQRYRHPYGGNEDLFLLNATPLDTLTSYPVKYIIVSDPQFEQVLQPFIEWKTRKGFMVTDIYTDNPELGSTPQSIKAWLQNEYFESSRPQSFVLLVGDDAQIPSFTGGTNDHYADFYFGEYTGDFLPDAYVGRFSANNLQELLPQLEKTLQYEQFTFPDPSFLDLAVMIAGMDSDFGSTHGNGQMNYATSLYFNPDHDITSYTYLYPGSGQSEDEIIFHVSQGVGFVNYTAHGTPLGWSDPAFTVEDIDDLNNTDKYPLMIGNGCSTNEFSVGACFGEALVRAENKGALGYIGASNDTYWDEDYYWSVGLATEIVANPTYEETGLGAYDRWFHDHAEPQREWYTTLAQMQVAGNLAVTESGSYLEEYYWEVYHLMGDPSLMVYFSQPEPLAITHDSIIPIGFDHFTVNTEPYTYVALSSNGELHGAAIAGSDGLAEIEISPFFSPDNIELVATKQNRKPYIDTLSAVTPEGPYVIFDQLTINDVLGNDDHMADYGESIALDLVFSNVGNEHAVNATAVIRSADKYVNLTDTLEENLSIPPGEVLSIDNAFALTIMDSIPDQHNVIFDLLVSQNDTLWVSSFSITLHAPQLEMAEITIDDGNGNNNGRLDAGEEIVIRLMNQNSGSSNAEAAYVKLECISPYISVMQETVNLGALSPGGIKNASFQVKVEEEAPLGENIQLDFTLEALPYSINKEQIEIIGVLDEDFESGDFSGYDWQSDDDSAWIIDENHVYEGIYSARSDTIGHGQTSSLRIEIEVLEAGPLSFYRKVSSEEGYDMFRFYIDGEKMDEWSGMESWAYVEYALSKGKHTLIWAYEKDATVSSPNGDAAWLDYIVFPPMKNSLNVQEILPEKLSFEIYPNPAVHKVSFDIQIPHPAFVSMHLYTAQGVKMESLLEEKLAFQKNFKFNVAPLPSGIYFVVLNYDNKRMVKKLVIHK